MAKKAGKSIRRKLGVDVFNAALDRMVTLYGEGHRVVCAFSGGKDSTCCLELCRLAAKLTKRGPVEAIMRDEEIMLPGTFEYCKRVAQYPDVDFHWVSARQPIVNIYNRAAPYFWVFDPQLKPEEWVRQPPDFCEFIDEKQLNHIITAAEFPPPKGKDTFDVLGLRVQESPSRTFGILSSKGYTTKRRKTGVRACRPIYDWSDGDVWKAIEDNGWDYNTAYTTMYRLGISRRGLRIAPPTLAAGNWKLMKAASRAWPQWFSRVCRRLPGVRSVCLFGKRVITPERKDDETWEECFRRECIENAPGWIAERSKIVEEGTLKKHRRHSSTLFPQINICGPCGMLGLGSWKSIAAVMFNGDPFAMKAPWYLKPIDPEFFREGAGGWEK